MIPHMARGFLAVGAIISLVLGIVAIYAYTRVKHDKVNSGGLIAIVVGIIMMVTTNWITGVITLIGGVICYASKPPTPSSTQSPQTASA